MKKRDMFDHVYDNTLWMKKNTRGEKSSDKQKRHCTCISILSVVFSLSLLANVILVCLYFVKNTNMFLHCEPARNCSNSGHEQVNKSCKYEENWKSLNNCPDLPEQWLKGKGSFYVFSSNNKTWSSSRQNCQSLGGDLVIINNPEEKDFLAEKLCITGKSNLYWTGTSERNWEGQEQVNCFALKGNTQGKVSCQRNERSICEIPCL